MVQQAEQNSGQLSCSKMLKPKKLCKSVTFDGAGHSLTAFTLPESRLIILAEIT